MHAIRILGTLNCGVDPDVPAAAMRSLIPHVDQFVGKWTEQVTHAKACLRAAQKGRKSYAERSKDECPTSTGKPSVDTS
jgi:hypothetical protein